MGEKLSKFEKLKLVRYREYSNWVKCYCPALKEYVYFTSDGFHHLRFKASGRPRFVKEQMYKVGLLPLAIPVIKNAVTAEYSKKRGFVGRKKVNGLRIKKEVEYWALTSIVGRSRTKVKVILRRVGTGKVVFWSIMKKTKQP